MANEISFDEFNAKYAPKQQDTEISFDDFNARYAAEPKSRSFGEVAGDVGVTALKGAVALPQAIVGIADIPAGGHVGKALEDIGYRPNETQKTLDTWYSPAQQEANRKVHNADGFVDTMQAAIENPSAIATTIGESIPQMIGGAGIARGIIRGGQAVGKVVAPWVAGAAGEGVIGAGSAEESIRGQTPDGLTTPTQSLAAATSGVGTATLGALGGKVSQRMGLADIDTMLAQGGASAASAAAAKAGFVKQVIGSGISEGVFEELPQSAQEQMWQNFALGKPLTDGVGNAAALGLLSGSAMGGVGGGYNSLTGRTAVPAPPPPTIPDAKNVDELISATKSSIDVELDNQTNQDLLDEISASNSATASNAPADQSYVPQPDTEPRLTIDIAPDVQPLVDNVEAPVAQAAQESQPTEEQNDTGRIADIAAPQGETDRLAPEAVGSAGIDQEQDELIARLRNDARNVFLGDISSEERTKQSSLIDSGIVDAVNAGIPEEQIYNALYAKGVTSENLARILPSTNRSQPTVNSDLTPTPSSTLPSRSTTTPTSTAQAVSTINSALSEALKPLRTEILRFKGEGKTVTGTKTIYDATDRLKAIAEDTGETSLKAQQVWFNSKRKKLEKNGDAEAAALFERIVAQLKEQINTAQEPAAVKIDDQVATVVVGKEQTTFKTAKGSSYTVHEDGTTTRTKAARSDVGHVSLATKNQDGGWGISPSAKNVDFETKPNAGSFPLELWNKDTLNGLPSYSAAHFGNAIVTQEAKPQPDSKPAQEANQEYELQQLGATSGEWKAVQKYSTQSEANDALPKGSGWRIVKAEQSSKNQTDSKRPTDPLSQMAASVESLAKSVQTLVENQGKPGSEINPSAVSIDTLNSWKKYPGVIKSINGWMLFNDPVHGKFVLMRKVKETNKAGGGYVSGERAGFFDTENQASEWAKLDGSQNNQSDVFKKPKNIDTSPERIDEQGRKVESISQSYGDTININGTERPKLNSNGKPIANSDGALRSFWEWFSDSAVTDDHGRPLVVYHGTTQSFTSFGTKESLTLFRNLGIPDGTFFFTDSPEVASTYAQSDDGIAGGNLIPTYIAMQNPHIVNANGSIWAGVMQKAIGEAADEGNDGAIVRNVIDDLEGIGIPSTVFVAFKQNQIKSVLNNGNFSKSDSNILQSKSPYTSENNHTVASATSAILEAHTGKIKSVLQAMLDSGKAKVVTAEQAAGIVGEDALYGGPLETPDAVLNPSQVESLSDGMIADAKSLADFANTNTFIHKGLSGFDVPTQLTQLRRVFRLVENRQIREVIVSTIPVDMMNMFDGEQLSAEMLLHKESVFRDLLAIDGNNFISSHIDVASRLVNVVALAAAKVANLSPLDMASGSLKGDTTSLAGKSDLSFSTGNGAVNRRGSGNSFAVRPKHGLADTANNVDHITSSENLEDAIIPKSERFINNKIFNDQDVKITAKFAKNNSALAFYNPLDDTTYFIADHIPENYTAKEWEGLVLHEIATHALQLGRDSKEFKGILSQVDMMRKAGNKSAAAAFTRASQALDLSSSPSFGLPESMQSTAYSASDILAAQAAINKLLDDARFILNKSAGGVQPTGLKMPKDMRSRASENLADLLVRQPAITQKLGSLDIKTQEMVLSLMRASVHNHEVFNSIVQFIPVDMMSVLSSGKLTSYSSLKDMAVFIDSVAINNNALVSAIDVAGRIAMSISHAARARAKHGSAMSREPGGHNVNNFTTESAGAVDSRPDRVEINDRAKITTEFTSSRNLNSASGTIINRHGVTLLSDVMLGSSTGETVELPPIVSKETLLHESLAYMIQHGNAQSITDRVLSWFRNAIRAIGKSFPTLQKMKLHDWAKNLSESDLRFMAESALKNAGRSGVQNESDTPQFSKTSSTININGVERSRLNSDGKPIANSDEALRNFYEWFGDSAVVDEQGRPLVVYHGGNIKFTTYNMSLTRDVGAHFGTEEQAKTFGTARSFYLSAKTNEDAIDDIFSDKNKRFSDIAWGLYDGDLITREQRNKLDEKYDTAYHRAMRERATYEDDRSDDNSSEEFWDKHKNETILFWKDATEKIIKNGFTGIKYENNFEGDGDSYIVFDPTQIKSAIGNNGNFDSSSNNILFSKNTNPITHPFQPENSGKPLDSWIKIFTRNQIVTLYRDSLIGKKLEEYKELRELVTADTNSLFEKADNFLLELRQIPKGLRDAFASLAHDSTLNNVDPSNPKYVPSPDAVKLANYLANNPTNKSLAAKIKKRLDDMEAAHKKLHAEFNALPTKEQELFKELRSKYTEQMTMVFDEFKNRIGRTKNVDPAIKIKSIKKLDEQLADLLGRVYFPLYRAGNYIVKAEKVGEPTTVDHVESNFAADRLEKKLKKLGYTVSRSTRIVSPLDKKSGAALNAVRDLLDKAALKGKIEGAELSQLMDDIDQTILQSLPDQSYRKSFIHRKGTKGYSDDFIRAYADAMRRGSINIANLRHGDKIATVIEDMRKDVKTASKVPGSNVAALNQVVDRVEQIEVDIRNPTSKLVSVSGKIAFSQMLGSLSNFILNLTQIPLLTMPHLGAEYGYGKANLQLAMAYAKQMRSLKKQGTLIELGKWLDMRHGLVGNELDLMQQLHDSGFLDLTQSFDLIDAANNPSYQENELSMNFMKVIALPQHVSEIVNRQVTALATIRLEMARSGSPLKAYRAAIKAIDQTHFNYSKENRSKLMTGNTQSMLFKFKQYPQQAAFLFVHTAKLALNGSTKLDSDGNKLNSTRPSERTKARKQLAGMLGMQMLVAGTLGLPIFAEAAVAAGGVAGFKLAGSTGAYVGVAGAIILAAALAFGDDDGEEFDVEVKKWFIKHFGEGIGSSLADGVIPRGLASRLNASELVIRRPEEARNSTDFANQWMISLLGAFWGGTVYNAGVGLKDIVEGDTAKGATKLIPVKAIKDLVTSWKWANDGMNVTNKDGEIITPVSKADIFFKSIGINPTSVVNAREYENAKFTLHNALLKKQQKALKELREETDKTKRFNAIIKYNKSAPLGYEIDSDKVRGVIAREIKYKGKPNVVTGNPVQEDYLNKNTKELRPAY